MRYEKVDDNRIRIIPETDEIERILFTIARKSYETAAPRGRGREQPFLHCVEEGPNFKGCITQDLIGEPMLLMDYINGRDCRTKVYKLRGEWFLDSYAFRQRKVTSEEFLDGVVKDDPEKFLDSVVEELSR